MSAKEIPVQSNVKERSPSSDHSKEHHVVEEDDVAAAPGTSLNVSSEAERALVWKFDVRILPVLAVMYLFNSLDKSNLGNAKTAGLEKTLKLKGNQYNVILSVSFVPYVLTAPFLSTAGKKY